MIVQRLAKAHCLSLLRNTPVTQYVTTYVWSQDGWMYDMTQGIRRQYFPLLGSSTLMEIVEEKTEDSVIPTIQHSERVSVLVYSVAPRVWIEKGERFEEVYVEQENIPGGTPLQ